jgi:hypothetical protein
MKYIKGKNRNQIEFYCLEELIEQDNEVRLIDLFVNSLPLSEYGFEESKQQNIWVIMAVFRRTTVMCHVKMKK